jgi:hypothetical protein
MQSLHLAGAPALQVETGAGEVHGAGEDKAHLGGSGAQASAIAGFGGDQLRVRPGRRRGDEHHGGGQQQSAEDEATHGCGQQTAFLRGSSCAQVSWDFHASGSSCTHPL